MKQHDRSVCMGIMEFRFELLMLMFAVAVVLVAGRSHRLDAPPGQGRMTSLFQILAAVIFGIGLGVKNGTEKASEFFAGYLLEKSLSVDNLFVFMLIFKYFKVPTAYQGRVLSYGNAGAVVFRAIIIGLGSATLQGTGRS